MASEVVTKAILEIENGRDECLNLLASLKSFQPVQDGHPYPPTYRLLVTPMLYSAWERCFTLCHAVGLRLIRDVTANPQALEATTRAVWLIQMPFYQSLVSRLQNQSASENEKPRKGQFAALCEFLEEFNIWGQRGFDASLSTANLVMTFSNVNPEVVEINAQAIGIAGFPAFKALKFGRLHDLVGSRNDIGHGARIVPPSNEQFTDLWQFTEKLIHDYSEVFKSWMLSIPGTA